MADFHKVTLNLRPGDWDYIESIYKPNGIATSLVVRTLVSNFVDEKMKEEGELRANVSFSDVEVNL